MTDPAEQDPPRRVPSFMCLLPCTNPPVKYLNRVDGCARGIHVTLRDVADPQKLYAKMAKVILSSDELVATSDPCTVCKSPFVPCSTLPVVYMESCAHFLHYDCFRNLAKTNNGVDCPYCGLNSSRSLLWPKVFPSETAKSDTFQAQKRSFGLDVAPQTVVQVSTFYLENKFLVYDCLLNSKHLILRWRRQAEVPPMVTQARPIENVHRKVTEAYLVQEIQDLHLADRERNFYLGEILPIEANPQFQDKHGLGQPMSELTKRRKLLLQFRCPFDRMRGQPTDDRCAQGPDCEFWHGWPKKTPQYIKDRVMLRSFPKWLCIEASRSGSDRPKCNPHIPLFDAKLVRCSAGFHPTLEELQNLDGLAQQMAQKIMEPVLAEQPNDCASCHTPAPPDSVRIHFPKCVHFLHMHCLPLARADSPDPNSIINLCCPICRVPSVRTIAWPGPFPSLNVKQAIFKRQLEQFKLSIQGDTELAISEVTNQVNFFTVDNGKSSRITVDANSAYDGLTVWLN